MNPYEAPVRTGPQSQDAQIDGYIEAVPTGRPCPFCGGRNTTRDMLSRKSPNLILVIYLSWIYFLIRSAFSKRIVWCRDCKEVHKYKSTRSKLAMIFLIILIFDIAVLLIRGA
jgi:hypothetical protein